LIRPALKKKEKMSCKDYKFIQRNLYQGRKISGHRSKKQKYFKNIEACLKENMCGHFLTRSSFLKRKEERF